jgi:hypothetical protein
MNQGINVSTPESLAAQHQGVAESALSTSDATVSNVAAAARQFAEVKGAIQLAREFPRNEIEAFKKMRRTCTRPAFADDALYGYPRGDTMVTGASIRLIEELVRAYRNIDYGFRIMEMKDDRSLVEAFAWDVENNIKARREFWVLHIRETKSGNYPLTSPRDIYELCANMAQRRVRSCIEEMLPIDLLEEAKYLCKKTMADGGDGMPFEDRVRNMVIAFGEYGVSEEMIEEFLGHPLEAMVIEEMPKLKQAHNAIKSGMARREEFFSIPKNQKTVKAPVKKDDDISDAEREILKKADDKLKAKRARSASEKQQPDADGEVVDPDSGEVTSAEPGDPSPEEIAQIEAEEKAESDAYRAEQEALGAADDDAPDGRGESKNDQQKQTDGEEGNFNLAPPKQKRVRKARATKPIK